MYSTWLREGGKDKRQVEVEQRCVVVEASRGPADGRTAQRRAGRASSPDPAELVLAWTRHGEALPPRR